MRRSLTALLVLGCLLLIAPSGAGAATFGISDQQASTFTNPLYKPLKLRLARYVAPYDVMSDSFQRQRFSAWYRAALSANQRILVSFEHSRTEGRQQTLPTKGQYTTAMRAFRRA